MTHWGFLLKSPDAIDEVVSAGGRLIERGKHLPGVPFVYVTDPDGYTIELVFDKHVPDDA